MLKKLLKHGNAPAAAALPPPSALNLISALGTDMEVIVAAPALQFSPMLDDQDLLEFIDAGRESGALTPIARRRALSGGVANAVGRTLDPKAVGILLANDSAQMREDALD